MILIDGSMGEGGGQILRTSLALALVSGQAFRIQNIRAHRCKPGLQRQHLTAVEAASVLGRAEVQGANVGSTELNFVPHEVVPGNYTFDVGTAGSATLVLQTILPALITAGADSQILLAGGTHNPLAPPFDFLVKTFLPILNRMGPSVTAYLQRPGFYPAGGGHMSVSIKPAPRLTGIHLLERSPMRNCRGRILISKLARHVAERELGVLREKLCWPEEAWQIEVVQNALGPGNVVLLELESDQVTEVITAFGERGVSAEAVAQEASGQVLHYLETPAPVGEHLADQLLLPMALAGAGSFLTFPLTQHTSTNIAVIKRFINAPISAETAGPNTVMVKLSREP